VDPAAAAARMRVAGLLEELARIELNVIVVARPDATREAARDRAREAAIAAGRGQLLDEAIVAVREAVLRTFARAGYSGTWAVTDMAVSVVRADDRVATAAAFEEAAMAEIVEDLVDEDTLDVLQSTAIQLRDMAGLPSPGSLSELAMPVSGSSGGASRVIGAVAACMLGAAAAITVGSVSGLVVGFGAFAILMGIRRRRRADSAAS
jgi:hypothetical protein